MASPSLHYKIIMRTLRSNTIGSIGLIYLRLCLTHTRIPAESRHFSLPVLLNPFNEFWTLHTSCFIIIISSSKKIMIHIVDMTREGLCWIRCVLQHFHDRPIVVVVLVLSPLEVEVM
jgi:hypothetical protein